MANVTGSGGQVPRKPSRWDNDLSQVTKGPVQPDGSYPEGVASLTYGADGTAVNVNADGGLNVHITGQAGGGSAITVADGADVAEGATTDAAVVTNTTGTISGKLRGLVAWAYTKMPAALGSTTSAGSLPVVIASDQAAVATKTADGVDVALGATTDAASTTTGTVIAHLRKIRDLLAGTVAVSGTFWQSTQPVSIATAPALVAGTAEIGRVGLSKTGTGYAPFLADAITTAVTVSSAAGKFGGLVLLNTNSTLAWLQVFDTTGAVILGTTVPTFTIPIPINSTAANGVGIVFAMDVGIAMANGIKVAATTTAKGATTVSTGLSGTLYYA